MKKATKYPLSETIDKLLYQQRVEIANNVMKYDEDFVVLQIIMGTEIDDETMKSLKEIK